MSEKLAIYPTVEVADVDPLFVRHMMLGAMAIHYRRYVTDLPYEDAIASARATWETDWPNDPEPRTFEQAIEAVDSDLEHWDEAS